MDNYFKQYASSGQMIVHGLRAKGKNRKGSDIDLTIVGEATYSDLLKLENELDNLLLPYKIDLSLLYQIANKDLIAHIERVGKVFYDKNHETVFSEPPVAYKVAGKST